MEIYSFKDRKLLSAAFFKSCCLVLLLRGFGITLPCGLFNCLTVFLYLATLNLTLFVFFLCLCLSPPLSTHHFYLSLLSVSPPFVFVSPPLSGFSLQLSKEPRERRLLSFPTSDGLQQRTGLPTGRLRPDDAFIRALEELIPLCLEEQEFVLTFFGVPASSSVEQPGRKSSPKRRGDEEDEEEDEEEDDDEEEEEEEKEKVGGGERHGETPGKHEDRHVASSEDSSLLWVKRIMEELFGGAIGE